METQPYPQTRAGFLISKTDAPEDGKHFAKGIPVLETKTVLESFRVAFRVQFLVRLIKNLLDKGEEQQPKLDLETNREKEKAERPKNPRRSPPSLLSLINKQVKRETPKIDNRPQGFHRC
jgi:hypothetical protein